MNAPDNVVSLHPSPMGGRDRSDHRWLPRNAAEALLFNEHRNACRGLHKARRHCERATQRQIDSLHGRENGFAKLAATAGPDWMGQEAAAAEVGAAKEAYAFLVRRCAACGLCPLETV